MKMIETKNAVGHVLCHDHTRIVKGEMKGVQFKKGHVVTEEDIPLLLSMGKDRLYVWEVDESKLHENEAAARLVALCKNDHMREGGVSEGKIELFAEADGLFRVDVTRLDAVNDVEEVMVATRHTDTPVKKGDKLCGTRVIPLVIDKSRVEEAERAAGGKPLLELIPFFPLKAGIVTTGNEVFNGRIKDTFTPVVIEKLKTYGIETVAHELSDDQIGHIESAIAAVRSKGVDIVLCTGGMSVDPDDMTPAAIKKSGAKIVTYGAPVLPGAMFLLGYYEDGVPVMGLPGCVMYAKATIFDIVLPRIAAGVRVARKDITTLGNGGLCLGCVSCTFPNCGFGKGSR
ncbi:MAG: molybdopterin-binding protein [Clostridiaceae bacterium]